MDNSVIIREERLSSEEYIDFLKRTDLGSQYPKERFEERIKKLVDNAIAEGLRIIDATNAATHIKEHADTLSDSKYMWIDWHYQTVQGEKKIPDYMNNIRNKFTSKELAEIEYALKEHCNNYENTIIKQSEKKGNLIVID